MRRRASVKLFLCGDVMPGRGIDQVLPHPSAPELHEPFVGDARTYVALAEEVNGPIDQPVDFSYIWGDALAELERAAADVRIINLETAVTSSDAYQHGKGIHYRMHPANVPCLAAAHIDGCVLANNHVLDWGHAGLMETLATLHQVGLQTAGAGRNIEQAWAPAVFPVAAGGRVLLFACAMPSSGTPMGWAAGESPGVNLLTELSEEAAQDVCRRILAVKNTGDVVVFSIHWGGNWGYAVSAEQVRFAHTLIDSGAVEIVYGHSSHHPKGIEVYRGRPILYGCGDFINDYEGIGGYEQYRGDLALMYFPTVSATSGVLLGLDMVPLHRARFSLHRASRADVRWLLETMKRECRRFGADVRLDEGRRLSLQW